MTDAHPALLRAVLAAATAASCPATLLAAEATDWASATFVGQRHRLRLRVAATPARLAWLSTLPEADWRIAGHLVADLAVEAAGDLVTLALLTLSDR